MTAFNSTTEDALVGFTTANGKAGVLGLAPTGNAVVGISDNGTGVLGTGKSFGITGSSTSGEGVHAHSDTGNAIMETVIPVTPLSVLLTPVERLVSWA